MYIFPEEKWSIVSFVHGYESAREGRCALSRSISERIATRYRIPAIAAGWPYQIERLAAKRQSDWSSTFKSIVSEVIDEFLADRPTRSEVTKSRVSPKSSPVTNLKAMKSRKKKTANQTLQTTSVTRSGFGRVSVSDRQRRGV